MEASITGKSSDLLNVMATSQTEAVREFQQQMFSACEQANRAWLDRLNSEMQLWSELNSTLSASRSVPEAMEACQKIAAERMKLAAEDGKRFTDNMQRMIETMTKGLSFADPGKRRGT